ncbi:MAG: zinc-ribbon domain-containing protein [Desulfarculaceae bacterium]|nr:zinc-ribbon domain-containing protein [Desulfarculaceae bacterium]MCF8063718.1 zinc-ribbon domain-containing protein [Desulfarculaceae bacterium]
MKVHCQTCGTDFRLDDSLVPPEGAWVRCSQCGDVFQVAPEVQEATDPLEIAPQEPEQVAPEAPEARPEPTADPQGEPAPDPEAGFWAEEVTASSLDLSQVDRAEQERASKRADFGLEQRPEIAERPPRGPLFKVVFWLIGILLLAAITALGSVLVMSRLGVGHDVVERAARLPGMAPLMGRSSKGGSQATDTAAVRMSLVEVKSFNRINETSGRIFVIQGKVVNHHPRPRSSVLVQGTLHDATGKTVRQASSYAGSAFTPEELRFLSLGAIERRLSSPLSLDGKPYVVAPGEPLPFMMVLTNVPDQPLEYTAAVIGSDPAEERPVLR